MRDAFECDDPLAERRYAYALSAAEEGDWATAAEVYEQALELTPHWAPAWFGLGEAREKLGDRLGAAAAFRAAQAADLGDAHGAGARLGLLEATQATLLPPAYIAHLFDDYAPRFDDHLIEGLAYRGPALIAQALDRVASARHFARALDLGCGTGLAGAALSGRVGTLIGVDLSPGMVAKARETGLYDKLDVGEVVAFLALAKPGSADLIIAADVLGYLGDLNPVFAGIARVLAPEGLFAASIETLEGDGFSLGPGMRFAHGDAHVREAADQAGLRILDLTPAALRHEAGREVKARIGVFARL